MKSFLALAFALSTTLRLTAQDVGARLDGRVPLEVQRAVQDIAADAAAHGLPTEPLVQKAIEGGAKRVPAERLIAAVRGAWKVPPPMWWKAGRTGSAPGFPPGT